MADSPAAAVVVDEVLVVEVIGPLRTNRKKSKHIHLDIFRFLFTQTKNWWYHNNHNTEPP